MSELAQTDNKSLVRIVDEAMNLEVMLIDAGGEVTEDIEKALAVNSKELQMKVDGYVEIIKRFESLTTYYKSRAAFFSGISKSCENAADRLVSNIKFAMDELKVTELKGKDMKFKISPTSGSLKITDEDLIPLNFKSEEVKTIIDTKSLKEAIARGDKIEGAEIVPGTSLRMAANTPEKKSKQKEAKNE